MLLFTPETDVITLKLFDNEILIRNIAVQLITTVQHRKQAKRWIQLLLISSNVNQVAVLYYF